MENSRRAIDFAANNLQWSIVGGLDAHLAKRVSIVNAMFIGSYPKRYKQLRIPEQRFHHDAGADDINVGFLNLALYKHISRLQRSRPHVREWVRTREGGPAIAVAYALTNLSVELLKEAKRRNRRITTIMIAPDLPQYMNTSIYDPPLRRLLKRFSMAHIMSNLKHIDGFVLLTRHMGEFLDVPPGRCTVVEGMVDETAAGARMTRRSPSHLVEIAYTGTLNRRYGILNLLAAFRRITNERFRLILCGAGDAEQEVVRASQEDRRIDFRGQLPPADVRRLQAEATLLVNPRQNTEEFARYSFPSKTLEYLVSGRPMVAYELDGIPDEYDRHICYVPDNRIESLADVLDDMGNRPSEWLNARGAAAREWVLREKNNVVQTGRILALAASLEASSGVS
jgi:glycosyltransferase involved in cell wall biosynthesis